METGKLLIKNDIAYFTQVNVNLKKNSNSLRELIFILTLLPCSWLKRRFSVKKNFALIIHMFLYDRYGVGMEQVLEAPGPAYIVPATGVKNYSKAL